jgi:hypothetical protein
MSELTRHASPQRIKRKHFHLRRYVNPVRLAKLPTGVNKSVTLLGKSRQSISNAMGVRVTTGMDAVYLTLTRRLRDRFSVLFDLPNRVKCDAVCPEPQAQILAALRRQRA